VRNIELRGETARAPGVERVWVENLYPLLDSEGDVLAIGVICEEITERKKVEGELASANVALRRTLDLLFLALRTAGVSVFTQDSDFRYIWVGGDYFGLAPEQVVGRTDAAASSSRRSRRAR
jgi:PAS domain-containing protein